MPIYEYKCSKCSNKFERLIAAKDKDNGVECPECGSADVQRLISAFSMGNSDSVDGSEFSCPTCNLG